MVKLGGSTANQAQLRVWIAALASSSLPIVVVPGGGPFADQVRSAQKRMGFSDVAAHAMAILAMEQFAQIVLDRQERLVPARSLDEIERAQQDGKVPVWLPSALAIAAPDIRACWDTTSDSLAAWIAGKIGAGALLLIKQTSAFTGADDVDSLTAKGIVDAGLAEMLPPSVDLHIAGPDDAAAAGAGLSAGKLPGTRMQRSAALRKTG